MLLEICANSYHSACQAESAGANRIELCSELSVGGITPSFGLIKKVTETLNIPVFVLIRPRSGNFTFSDEEFEIMKYNILQCKALGCKGIVSGVLNADSTVNLEKTQALIELAKPLPFTFHRAFDWVKNPVKALEELLDIGVDRVLTSGQESTSEKGIELLKALKNRARDRIKILPGGGINAKNAHLFKVSGFDEIHCSASSITRVINRPRISMNSISFFDECIESYSDADKIKAILQAVQD